ncbi:MAG: hypothetical protein H6754_03915 [Candidatus Omnitrophica bacterium]|nr:hypothetical protein [Candidatus Omnitrophota bacterium]
MKNPAIVIYSLATFFILLGTLWFACIQIRCEEISPRPVLSKAVSVSAAGISLPVVKKVRSVYAKPYHDILFWIIAGAEVFVATFYVLAGVFLFKRFVLARVMALTVLGMDIAFKLLVILYMKFAAIPLSALTKNENILQLYFMPSQKIHHSFSAVVTGLKFYLPGNIFYLMTELVFFGVCFTILSRPEIKNYLMRSQKI